MSSVERDKVIIGRGNSIVKKSDMEPFLKKTRSKVAMAVCGSLSPKKKLRKLCWEAYQHDF